MKIIISPAKTMNVENDIFSYKRLPYFLDDAKYLLSTLQKMKLDDLIKLWKVSYKLGLENFNKIKDINIEKNLTPAIFAYEGIQYKNIAPKVLSENALEYIDNNLIILSGVYGALKAFDGIVPYRLEMQSKLDDNFSHNILYEFWGDRIYEYISKDNEDGVIINLASKEYSKVIEDYILPHTKLVNCIFGEIIDGKLKVKATKAKMARGSMVRYMAENNISKIDEIKSFNELGFKFAEELSDDNNLIFILS